MVFAGTNNKMDARSVPAVALHPSNSHGGHYFMSLYSGKRIHSYHWQEAPIDDDIVDRVEALALEEEALVMARGFPTFTWKQRSVEGMGYDPLDATDEDIIHDTSNDADDSAESNVDSNSYGDHGDDEGELSMDESSHSDDDLLSFDSSSDENNENLPRHEGKEDLEYEDESLDDVEVIREENVEVQEIPRVTEVVENVEGEVREHTAEVQEGVTNIVEEGNGRPRRDCVGQGVERLEMSLDNNKECASVKSHHYVFGMTEDEHPLHRGNTSFMSVAASFLFAQVTEHARMSAKAGIKRFGDRAVAAMLSEY